MEESVPCRRSDGSVVAGLTCSDWESYKKDRTGKRYVDEPNFGRRVFEVMAERRYAQNARKKGFDLQASLASPLFMLLSVEVKPVGKSKLFSVYGEITSHGCFDGDRDYIYKRPFEDAENVGSDGGYLTLNGPCGSCRSDAAYNILSSSKLSVNLYQRQLILVDDCIHLDYSQNEFEEVIYTRVFDKPGLTLIFKYLSIPMATYGLLELNICNKSNSERKSVKLYGKVVAKYKNGYGGNYSSEDIVLFKKNPDEYETVVVGSKINLLRHWLAVPTYSLLFLHLDLFEFGTNQQILKKYVELEVQTDHAISKDFVTTEFVIQVFPSWFAPYPPREFKDGDDSGQEECEDAEDSGHGEPMDGGGDGLQISRMLRPSTILCQFSALEVFSVLIYYKKCMPLKIHGLLQYSFDSDWGPHARAINIFKKGKEEPLSLSGRSNTIPVLEGSRRCNNCDTLSVICDLKGNLGELSIKGSQSCQYDRILYPDRPLCSIFRGDRGFAALHYAIFTSAVQANLKVFYTENGFEGVGSPVFGSFCAEYNDFDCPSEYEKNCYKIVLFQKIRKEDSVQVGADGLIPLSRSLFVVPSDSSFTFDLHLMIGTREFSGEKIIKTKGNIKTDTISTSIKVDECEVRIDLEWSEVQ